MKFKASSLKCGMVALFGFLYILISLTLVSPGVSAICAVTPYIPTKASGYVAGNGSIHLADRVAMRPHYTAY
jgi:hypothetical protein